MKRQWVVFKLHNKELVAITADGYFIGEIKATKELLAYENNVDTNEIEVALADRRERWKKK